MFVPFSIYISKFISIKFFKKKIISLIILSLIIFVGRNISRINNEVEKYNYNILTYPYYYLDEVNFRVDKIVNNIQINHQNCINKGKLNCIGFEKISVTKKNIYYILKKNKWLYLILKQVKNKI